MREYGRCADGREILAPSGWKLLPEGEAVPSFHREAKEDGTWCSPRRCRSTMTPLFACVSGYVRAFAVPEAYSIIPAGATDFVTDQFASEFGRTLLREPLAKLRVEGCCAATLAVFTRFLTAAGAIRLPT
jgi:hypothetical protein